MDPGIRHIENVDIVLRRLLATLTTVIAAPTNGGGKVAGMLALVGKGIRRYSLIATHPGGLFQAVGAVFEIRTRPANRPSAQASVRINRAR
jgi:hypothetical protein